MATIRVTQAHRMSVPEAKQALGAFEEQMAKYGISLNWSGDRAEVKGVGVSGNVLIGANDVSVTLELGFLARAAGVDAKRLEGSIARRLQASFGAASPPA